VLGRGVGRLMSIACGFPSSVQYVTVCTPGFVAGFADIAGAGAVAATLGCGDVAAGEAAALQPARMPARRVAANALFTPSLLRAASRRDAPL